MNSCALAHNDSGDGPFVYVLPQVEASLDFANLQGADNDFGDRTGLPSQASHDATRGSPLDISGQVISKFEIMGAEAVDWEDMTTDPSGRIYAGDFGDNLRRRDSLKIYRYDPRHAALEIISYSYPGGRRHDCEAMVFQSGSLHLFTKAKAGRRGGYWTYHYRLPAREGFYTADLVDSLYLPRRVVTAADVDSLSGQLILTAYNYKRILGFFPAAASSILTFSDYPDGQFFRGNLERRNLSWAIPNQVEGVAFYSDRYFYVAREKTGPWQSRIRRKKRRRR
ncbi:MAG: hypothetical protein AAFP08_06665 [Bacteroidota bacterium]